MFVFIEVKKLNFQFNGNVKIKEFLFIYSLVTVDSILSDNVFVNNI